MSTARPRPRKEFVQEAALRQAFGELLNDAKPPETAAREWLELLVTVTGAERAGFYQVAASGSIAPVAVIGASTTAKDADDEAEQRRERLLRDVVIGGRPQIVPRIAKSAADDGVNALCGVYVPLALEANGRAVIELALLASTAEAKQHAVVQAALVAAGCWAEYERRKQRKEDETRRTIVDEVEQFVRKIHEKLDVRHTTYTAANDGRRLIGCDRATVLLRRGDRYVVCAASGVDEVEHRSQAAKLLSRLVQVTAKTGETVHFDGNGNDLSPQTRDALNEYLDEATVRAVTIVPLLLPAPPAAPDAVNRSSKRARPLGAIVIEQMEDVSAKAGRSERISFVAEHTALALAKALEHEAIPLLPLWRAYARAVKLFAPGTRSKTWAVIATLTAAVAALCFVPADFTLHARGTLQPTVRRHVFAPLDATVKAIHVRHGEHVSAGQLLVELRNTDLDVSLADVTGRRTAAQEQLLATERSLFEGESQITLQERHRLTGRRSELKQQLASLDEQLRLLRHKREMLRITSPIEGEVTTWNIEQLLRDRPVRQGQVLIDVADAAGGWELEVQVPEDGVSHLLTAQETNGPQLDVHYRLAAEPRTDRLARLREVHYSAEIRGEEGNTVLALATLAEEPLPVLRPGAEATAKIYCGRRALGYVWLHDAVDFLRMKVWFRLY